MYLLEMLNIPFYGYYNCIITYLVFQVTQLSQRILKHVILTGNSMPKSPVLLFAGKVYYKYFHVVAKCFNNICHKRKIKFLLIISLFIVGDSAQLQPLDTRYGKTVIGHSNFHATLIHQFTICTLFQNMRCTNEYANFLGNYFKRSDYL